MFYLADFLRTSNTVDKVSDSFKVLLQRGKGKARLYREILQQILASQNIKIC